MKLELQKLTAKRLYPDAPEWFQEIMRESFGKDFFTKKDFRDIKTFEDACFELGISESDVYTDQDSDDEVAYKKLKVIAKAINQGWVPDWDNTNQRKWWPWFKLASGFGFSGSDYDFAGTITAVGSRLCFESEEKSDYAAKQFSEIYEQLLTIKK